MKIQRLILIASLLVVAAALVCAAFIFYWQHSQPRLKSLPRLAMAVESYSRDYVSRGQPFPSSVTLQDLVNGGYISAKEVQPFDGIEVTIYPTVSHSNPQAILVRARMPDGVQIVAMADGSVHQLPK